MSTQLLLIFFVVTFCTLVVWGASRRGDFRRDILKAKSGNWSRHQAAVTSTGTEVVDTFEGAYIRCIVHYKYSVAGIEGNGKYTFSVGSHKEAEQLLGNYYAGSALPIRYDPQNRAVSVPDEHAMKTALFHIAD